VSAASWKVLVPPGERQQACTAAVEAITADLAAARDTVKDVSLAQGAAGLAATFVYLAQCYPGRDHEQLGDAFLNLAIDGLAAAPLMPGLYGGYAGVAWSYAHLAPLLYEEGAEEDALSELEEALLDVLEEASPRLSHELIAGIAGIATYAVARATRPVTRRILERAVGLLEARAERVPDGVTWATTPEMRFRDPRPPRAYNLGVSHGVPGTVTALAAIVAAGVDVERARPLLAGSLRWTLAQVRGDGPIGLDYEHVPGEPSVPARLAWCYGDAGGSVALLEAARVLGDDAMAEAALDLGRRAARRGPETSGVGDAGLCHGAIGVAHIFNRLWQASGEARFEEAALAWIDRGLAMRGSQGPGGFLSQTPTGTEETLGFLEGAAGIALGLAAAMSTVSPWWDETLLLSLPRPLALG
jgi:lantibiotic biosynthesis protein